MNVPFQLASCTQKRLIMFALISENWAEVLILIAVLQLIFSSAGERQWQRITIDIFIFLPPIIEKVLSSCVYTFLGQSFPSDFHYYICTFGQWRLRWKKIRCCFNCTTMYLLCFCPLQAEVWALSYSVQEQCLTFLLMLLLNLCSPHADVFWYQNLKSNPEYLLSYCSICRNVTKGETTHFPLFLEKSCIQAWQ